MLYCKNTSFIVRRLNLNEKRFCGNTGYKWAKKATTVWIRVNLTCWKVIRANRAVLPAMSLMGIKVKWKKLRVVRQQQLGTKIFAKAFSPILFLLTSLLSLFDPRHLLILPLHWDLFSPLLFSSMPELLGNPATSARILQFQDILVIMGGGLNSNCFYFLCKTETCPRFV